MKFNVLVIGEANIEDRNQLVKDLITKGIEITETGNKMHVTFEDHDLVVSILKERFGVTVNKVATEKLEEGDKRKKEDAAVTA